MGRFLGVEGEDRGGDGRVVVWMGSGGLSVSVALVGMRKACAVEIMAVS